MGHSHKPLLLSAHTHTDFLMMKGSLLDNTVTCVHAAITRAPYHTDQRLTTFIANKMAADATSLLLVILTVSPLALPETGGRSDSSIPLVAPNSLGSFDWSEDWRTPYDVKIGKEPISEERAKEDSQVTRGAG